MRDWDVKRIQGLAWAIFALILLAVGKWGGSLMLAYALAAALPFGILSIFFDVGAAAALARAMSLEAQSPQAGRGGAGLFSPALLAGQAFLALALGAGLFAAAPWLAEKAFLLPYAFLPMRILAAALVVKALNSVFAAGLTASGAPAGMLIYGLGRPLFFGLTAVLLMGPLKAYGAKVGMLLQRPQAAYMYGAVALTLALAAAELFLALGMGIWCLMRKRSGVGQSRLGLVPCLGLGWAGKGKKLSVLLVGCLALALSQRAAGDVDQGAVALGIWGSVVLPLWILWIGISYAMFARPLGGLAQRMRQRKMSKAGLLLERLLHLSFSLLLPLAAAGWLLAPTLAGALLEGYVEVGQKQIAYGACILCLAPWVYILTRALEAGALRQISAAAYVLLPLLFWLGFGSLRPGLDNGGEAIALALAAALVLELPILLFAALRQLGAGSGLPVQLAIPVFAAGLVCLPWWLLQKWLGPHLPMGTLAVVLLALGLLIYYGLLLGAGNLRSRDLGLFFGRRTS